MFAFAGFQKMVTWIELGDSEYIYHLWGVGKLNQALVFDWGGSCDSYMNGMLAFGCCPFDQAVYTR
jgi:hypothetical protein